MEATKKNWITGLAALLGVFLLFLSAAIGFDGESNGAEKLAGLALMGVPGLVLFGGLWGLRSGRYSRAVSYGAVLIGLAAAMVWFWMLIPPVVALVVLWFGVIRGGLAKELAVAPAGPPGQVS